MMAPLPMKAETDWFLQSVVNFANDWGVETGLTLQVGGLLVSGIVISGTKYFDEFSGLYATGFKNDPDLGTSFSSLIASYKKYIELLPEEKTDLAPGIRTP